MAEAVKQARPEFRNIGIGQLARYRLPWAGKVSILHRVSGALLFLLLPFILYLFEQSVTSELSFAKFSALLSGGFVKLVLLVLIWGYLHHFCAGIRFLLLDMHVGVDKPSSAKSAIAVLIVSLLLTVVFGLKLFGVF
ncbi:succinate dehydrogenase, cytochrome b556 subunit [Cupriavidus gilardii]|uniref:succinate dehydrogenase, cytochrome b556 subunit n=1 Tax=Cupriavidus TaxID=106589 RepID=UPI001574BD22|nr:succinate dehydrogenase, cytochrome b556 subunit [Cupriavidus gilardii]MBO4121200.1 succinate dehydrogenase, cytochrome b556 subunit [Cupriavidus gilardii]MCG5262599.1 succinate dehydrogenase, cytochrome b556 subunit [Cupriavidus gilardii]MDF9430066.1 succinate dehydrogenase, cytochrome b556 subunit [Cupriavidus gilardii]NSX05243.1 succinate dehydrogenase, cytochrome b556 subunit [Cupriavidus gilardii]